MKINLDPKSAVLGLALGVAVTLALGAALPPGSVGRFQIAGTDGHMLIVDSTTGQVWRGYFPPGGGTTDGDFLTPKVGEKK